MSERISRSTGTERVDMDSIAIVAVLSVPSWQVLQDRLLQPAYTMPAEVMPD